MKSSLVGVKASEVNPEGYETVSMGIDDMGLDALMFNLSAMYSEHWKAITREYTANALDSHVKAGQSRPIEVTFPKYGDLFLTVEDFGVGLSRDEIKNVYSRYGASTKRKSNAQIGAFGLGSKSALAAVDRFDLVSVKDGMKTVAFVEKHPSTGVGQFYFVSEEPTSDPSGVKVVIPAHPRDFGFSPHDFFLGWKPESIKLTVDGSVIPLDSVYNENKYIPIETGPEQVIAWIKRDAPKSASSTGNIYAFIGPIRYSLTENECRGLHGYALLKDYFREVFVNLPIGSVDLVPSREELRYTPRTRATLAEVFAAAVEALGATIQAEIEAIPDRLQAASAVVAQRTGRAPNKDFMYRGSVVPHTIALSEGKWGSLQGVSGKSKKTIDMTMKHGLPLTSWAADNFTIVKVDSLFQVERISKDYKDYFGGLSGYGSQPRVLFTTERRTSDVWIKERLSAAITLDEFMEKAKAFRKERYAVRRETRITLPPTPKAEPEHFGVLDGKEGVFRYVSYTESELKEGKVAYIHQNNVSKGLASIWPSNTTRQNTGNLYDRNNALWMMGKYFPEYTIVFVRHNRSMVKFMATFPDAVTVDSLLPDKAKAIVEKYKDQDVLSSAFHLLRTDYGFANVIRKFTGLVEALEAAPEFSVESITSAETRRMMVAFKDFFKAKESPADKVAYWANYVPAQNAEVVEKADEIREFVKKYPLLAETGVARVAPLLSHLTGYVNMVDSME
jgi:Histidine kinase-, DNA gyrase B-, and HSP90-like ATPase